MATEMKIWRVSDNKKLETISDIEFELNHLEKDLESWIAASPDILGEDLLVVARQYITPVPLYRSWLAFVFWHQRIWETHGHSDGRTGCLDSYKESC